MSQAKKPEIMQFFEYDHLPEVLQTVSKPFSQLAEKLYGECAPSAELSVALRKLLEAKDAAVRAQLLTVKALQPENATGG